ncbi:MAG: sugar phosphate isomerase/epimerase, partial [Clostridia bacterium]|nr:sugar phosphate isomerase/epimerase [Clostridia bacterium]
MKLGIVSAIYDGFSFEEMIDNAAANGYECVEVACWPQGKAERRYAGVSHIDVENTSEDYIKYVKDYCAAKKIEISSLAFYPNTMDGDLEKRAANIDHLKKVI